MALPHIGKMTHFPQEQTVALPQIGKTDRFIQEQTENMDHFPQEQGSTA